MSKKKRSLSEENKSGVMIFKKDHSTEDFKRLVNSIIGRGGEILEDHEDHILCCIDSDVMDGLKFNKDTQKLSLEGIGEGCVGGGDLMTILEVPMENSTFKIYKEEDFPKVIELCEKENLKYDVSLWRRVKNEIESEVK